MPLILGSLTACAVSLLLCSRIPCESLDYKTSMRLSGSDVKHYLNKVVENFVENYSLTTH